MQQQQSFLCRDGASDQSTGYCSPPSLVTLQCTKFRASHFVQEMKHSHSFYQEKLVGRVFSFRHSPRISQAVLQICPPPVPLSQQAQLMPISLVHCLIKLIMTCIRLQKATFFLFLAGSKRCAQISPQQGGADSLFLCALAILVMKYIRETQQK